jgi:hypothetical protein
MYFANPWGLLALAAIPAIVAIHLFRRRFPPLYVAGAHLWGAETRVTDAGRRRDRLPITPSLLLELLAALLLAVALSEPRLSETDAAPHLIAVLDDSASMQARGEGPRAKPFRDQAIDRLRSRVAAVGRDARVTLIRTGLHPTLLGDRGMSWRDAEGALATWRPSAARHDFHPAWDEAVQLVGREGSFLFLTDHLPGEEETLPAGMEVVAVGQALPNVAFSAARWTIEPDGGRGQIFLRVANLGAADAIVRVSAAGPRGPAFAGELRVPAKAEAPLEQAIDSGLGPLTLTLASEEDGLPADDTLVLVEPQPRTVSVAIDLPADSLERRLAERALATLPDVEQTTPDVADLVIGEASTLPPSRPDLWWLGLGPLNRSEAFRKQAVDTIGPWLIERQHPLMDGVTLGGIVWGGVQPTELRLVPIISVDKTILLGRLEGTQTTAWLMNVDLARSNLQDSPDWPILISNLVELRRDALPGLRTWNYRLEESVQLRLPRVAEGQTGDLSLVLPDGRRRPLVRDRGEVVEVPPQGEPGLYRIVEGATEHGRFAVNFFDVRESSLLALSSGEHRPPQEYEPAKISLDNPFSWLIVLAILLILGAILLDWRVLSRGRLLSASPQT